MYAQTRTENSGSSPNAINVQLCGEKLDKKDTFGKSDPFLKIYATTRLVYRSEIIHKTTSPTWKPFTIAMDTVGGPNAFVHIECWDFDSDGGHDIIGSCDIDVRKLGETGFSVELHNANKKGGLLKKANSFSGTLKVVTGSFVYVPPTPPPLAFSLQCYATNLESKDGVGKKSDPFLIITNAANEIVNKTEFVQQNLNPDWKPFTITVSDFGSLQSQVIVKCYDWDEDGSNDFIGAFSCPLEELLHSDSVYPLVNPDKKKPMYKNSGLLHVRTCQPTPPPYLTLPPAFSIKCSALKLPVSLIGKTDPFFKVYTLPNATNSRSVLIYKSPVIKGNRNPSWPAMELRSSALLNTGVLVEVWDWEQKGNHSKLGETRINLREMLLPTPYFSLVDQGKNTGSFFVESATPISEDKLAPAPVGFTIQCSASKLDRKDGPLSKSDPFFEVYKSNTLLYRSEFLKQNLNPSWQPFVLRLDETNGMDSQVEIKCYDWDGTGAHDLIGKTFVSIRECSFGEMQIALINPEKVGNMGYKSSGSFSFDVVDPIYDPRALPPSGFPSAPAYRITCCANKIQKRGLTSTPAPYFEVSVPLQTPADRFYEPYNSVCLYRSEVLKNTANPEWAPFTINLHDIVASGQVSQYTGFDIKCYDWSEKGHHKLLGVHKFLFKDLAFKTITVPLLDKPGQSSQNEEDSNGGFSILSIETLPAPIVPQWQQTGVPPALRLTFHGVSLDALDTMGKSDPFFDITILGANYQTIKLYRSEVIKSTLNPEWKEFDIPWAPIGGLDSPIKISCYDWDKTGGHDIIGVSILTLRLLLMGSFVHPLYKSSSGKSGGGLKVVDCKPLEYFSSPYSTLACAYKVKFSAKKLDSKDLLGSDPFFDIVCKPPNFTKPIKLYRSEVIKKNLNPEWAPFELTTSGVGGLDTVFTINCYDWDLDGSHDLIGSVTTTLRDFTFGAFDVALINPEKANKSGYESSGALCIEEFSPLPSTSVKPLYPIYECHCSAVKIERMDGGPLGKADPFFEVFVTPPGATAPIKVYRSEVCKKTLSPKWNPFRIDVELFGGFDQFMRIDCYDWDPDGVHDLIGSLETTLREFTFGPTQIAIRHPDKIRDSGYQSSGGFSFDKFIPLSVAVYNIPPALAFRVTASGSKIKSDDLIRKADPFFEVFAKIPGTTKQVKVYRSEVIKQDANPEWAPFVLSVAEIGGLDATFEVQCWDWDKDGGHDIVGKTTCTLREWLIGAVTLPLLHQSKSGGGFTVSTLEPMAFVPDKPPLAPAYNIFCSGMKLEAKDSGINAKSDPFFEVAIEIPGVAKPIKLYRSEVVMKDLNPLWKPFQLCTADVNGIDGLFTVTVYDWDRDGTHDIIGRNTVNLRELLLGPVQLALRDPEREHDGYQSSGAFSVDGLVPLPYAAPKAPIAPAYLVKCSAKKLAKKDAGPLGKSDPYFEVICQPPGYYHPIKLYRSEVIKQNLNPDWIPFELNTSSIGSIDTLFTINCFDWDKDGSHDLIGSLSTTLREFTFGPVQMPLIDPEKAGRGSYESSGGFGVDEFIPLTGEVVRPIAPAYRVYTSAMKLDKKDPGPTGKSDPFFVISVRYSNGYEAKLYRSEVVMKDLNPKWKAFDLNIADVGGMDGLFTVECYDWDADGSHDLIGRVTTTFREFTFGSVQLALLDPEKAGSRGYQSSGAFSVDQIEPLANPIIRPFYPAYKLHTGGTKLAKRGLVGKSDAFFEIFAITPEKRIRLYKSEVINGDDSPVWAPVDVSVNELGGFDVPFAVKCFNWDKAGAHLLFAYIGECILTLRECLLGNITSALIDDKQSRGGFTVFSCIPESNPPTRPPPANAYEIHCSGMNLDSKNGPMQKSDPYFEISATPPGYTEPIKIYRSSVVKQTLEPKWEPFALNVAEIGGLDSNFTIDCYDWEKDGANQLIGSLTTTVRDFMFGPVQIALINPEKVGKLNYKSSGAFSVDNLIPLPSAPLKPPVAPAYFVECCAQKLTRKELIGKTDAFFEVLCHPTGYPAPIKLHRSEVVRDSLSPSWQGFQLSTAAVGGLDTPFTINCLHWDKEGGHQFIGCIKTTLREFTLGPLQLPLVSAKAAAKKKKGHKKTSGAFLVNTFKPLEADQIKFIAPAYSITASGIKLDKKDNLLGKSDPFFVVSAPSTGKLYRSETITQDLNPKWKAFSVNIRDVGGLDSPFTISVFDWDADGVHSLIGEFTTTFREFTFGSYQFGLVNPKKKDNIGYKTSGAFSIDEVAPLAFEVARPLAPAYRVHCHAAQLDRKDVLGKSDGFFEVYSHQLGPNGKPRKLYRSEVIKQELSPEWVPFDVSVADAGGIDSPLTIKCYDWDESGAHDYIGTVECSLRECLFGNLTLPLINAGKLGRIGYKTSGGFSIPTCEPLAFPPVQAPPAAAYLLSFSASSVDKKNALASSADPFFEISVSRPSMPDRPIKLYRSPVINNSVNPTWGPFTLNTQEVGGMDGEFTINFYDWEKNGAHVQIGRHTTTLREFTFGPFEYPIINVEKAGRFGYSSSGALSITGFSPLMVAPPAFPITPAYWLKCSATKLDKKDVLGKSDPYFEVSITPQGYTRPIKLHRSEVIKNSTEADWTGFQIPFGPIGGWDTLFTVKCFDWDADGAHELIGECKASLRELSLGSVQLALINPNKAGRLGYTSSGSFSFDDFQPLAEHSIKPIAPAYTLHVSGAKLDKKDGPLGASDPFFVLSRNGIKLYRSEAVKQDLNPKWAPFNINIRDLNGIDELFTIDCYDWDADGVHSLIGSLTTTFREFTFGPVQIALINPRKVGRIGYSSSGAFSVDQVDPLRIEIPPPIIAPCYRLFCSGTKLPAKDLTLKADPFFEVSVSSAATGRKLRKIYRSETIKQSLTPEWLPVDLNVEDPIGGIDNPFTVKVFDWDSDGGHDYIGSVSLTLRECRLGNLTVPIINEAKASRIGYVSSGGFTVSSCDALLVPPQKQPIAQTYLLNCSSAKLDAKDGVVDRTSDPFIEVSVKPPGYPFPIKLHRSAVQHKTLNPTWEPFALGVADVGGWDAELTITCYDWDKDGSHDLIGTLTTNLREFSLGPVSLALINPSKVGRPLYQSSGSFAVNDFIPLSTPPPSFSLAPAYRIRCSAEKLDRKDGPLAKSDPFFVVTAKPPGFTKTITLHRSPVIKQTLSPEWPAFELPTSVFGTLDTLFKVSCYDWDADGGHDLIGEFSTTLRELTFGAVRLALVNPAKVGRLGYKTSGGFSIDEFTPVALQDLTPVPPAFRISAGGKKIDGRLPLTRPDPFFVLSRLETNGSHTKLYRSEAAKNDSSPIWQPFEVNLSDLGGLDSNIVIDCYDWNGLGFHELIGSVTTTFREFTFGPYEFGLINPKKRANNALYQTSGAFSLQDVQPLVQEVAKPLAPSYKLECRASKLDSKDISLSSDPFIEVVSLRAVKPRKVFRSEVIKKNLNPEWKPFDLSVEELGGIDYPFIIRCYDWDEDGGHDIIGTVQTTLRECLFGNLTLPLAKGQDAKANPQSSAGGISIVKCTPQYYPIGRPFVAPGYLLHCSGRKLDSKDALGKSDPFFEITVKPVGANKPIKLYRSSVQKDTLNPTWEPCELSVYDVGGIDGEFTINCYDHNKDGAHALIGSVTTTLWEFTLGPVQLALINPAKVGRPLYETSGAFSIDQLIPLPTASLKPSAAPAYKVKCLAVNVDRKDGLLGESDPFFEILCQPPGYSQQIKLYRSDVVKKNRSPEWVPFELSTSAVGGLDIPLTINCYDWDKNGGHDLIGSLTTTLRDFSFGSMASALVNPAKLGRPGYRSSGAFIVDYFVPIPLSSVQAISPSYKVNIRGVKLDSKDTLGKSDPFFVVSHNKVPLYRSEVIKQDLNPVWNAFDINILDLHGLDSLFDIECYDWDADGVHDLIGKLTTTFREFTFGPFDFGLINKNKEGRIGYTTSGALHVEIAPVAQLPPKWTAPAYKLHCQATKLACRDILARKLDPFFEVYVGSKKVHRSEIVKQSVDPKWNPFDIIVGDVGGLDQKLTIKCFDWDKNENKEYVGSCETSIRECTLGAITIPLRDGASSSSAGGFTISKCEALSGLPPSSTQFAPAYDIRCKGKLPSKVVGSTNAFFEVVVKSTNIKVYRSQVQNDTREPVWEQPCILRFGDIGGLDGEIIFNCYDFDKDGSHSFIGSHTTTLREFTFGLPAKLPLINQEKLGSFGYINSGSISVLDFIPLPTAPSVAALPPAFEVKCSAQKLDRKDALGKSDPYFEVLYHPQGFPAPLKLHRSEVIQKELNPSFAPFQLSTAAINGLDVPFTVTCYDWDKDGGHDLIGSLSTTLRELSLGPVLLPLINPNKVGRLGYHSSGGFYFDYAQPLSEDKLKVYAPAYQFNFSAQKLDRKDGPLGKSDPFFVIKKQFPGYTEPSPLYRSEVVKQNLDPTWNPVSLNTATLGLDEPFTVEVFDWDKDGIHELIGKLTTTLREFTLGSVLLGLKNPKLEGRIGYQTSGAFSLDAITPLAAPIARSLAPAYLLHCSANALDRKDVLGTSDPYFEISLNPPGTRPIVLYRSEFVSKNLSPTWQPVEISLLDIGNPYFPISVTVYDSDKNGSHDLIGSCTLTLDECILGSLTLPLINPSKKNKLGYKSSGSFTVSQTQPLAASTKPALAPAYRLICSATDLDNKDRFLVGKTDPFFEVVAANGFRVHQSEDLLNSPNPEWAPFVLDLQTIGGLDTIFGVSVLDRDRTDSDEVVGRFEATLRDVLAGNFSAALVNPYKTRIGYKSSGAFKITAVPVYEGKKLPEHNAFKVTFDFEWGRKKKTATPIRIEGKPNGVSEYVLVAYAPLSSSSAVIRLEDIRSPYDPIRVHALGYNPVETTLHELLFPMPTFHLLSTKKGKFKGLLRVKQVENFASPLSTSFALAFSATNLDAMDGLGEKSDPFLVIKSPLGVVLHTTDVIPQTLSPTWNPFVLDTRQLGLLLDHPLLIECVDYDPDGTHDLIGIVTEVPLRTLFVMQSEGSFPIVNPYKKQQMARYTNSGQLFVKINMV